MRGSVKPSLSRPAWEFVKRDALAADQKDLLWRESFGKFRRAGQ
jgi:hypothetical protein